MTALQIFCLLPLAFLIDTLITWTLYLAIMHLKESRDMAKIPQDAMTPAKLLLAFGLFWDFRFHVFWGSIIFLDIPREWLLTSRLKRYQEQGGWRGRLATYICTKLLDWADPDGCHCKKLNN